MTSPTGVPLKTSCISLNGRSSPAPLAETAIGAEAASAAADRTSILIFMSLPLSKLNITPC